MEFSVAMEDPPPLGSALNPIVIDSDEFESDQMEDFQLDGHGVFEVDDIAIEASYQPNVDTLGSKYNPIIIDDDDEDDNDDNDALDAYFGPRLAIHINYGIKRNDMMINSSE